MTSPSPVQISQPNFCFVFTDLTTSATPSNMAPGPALQSMIDAISEQVGGPFADAHGHVTCAFRIASAPGDRGPGEIAVNFRDTTPEAQGALAYHTVTNGIPDVEIAVDLFQTLTDGSNGQESVSGGVSHEILELLKDAGANGWKDKDDNSGQTGAEEVCDPVQNTGYPASNGVWVSNFVLASYWVPGSAGPWDYLGCLAAVTNDEIKKYGYEVQATAPTDFQQVSGLHHGAAMVGARCVFVVGWDSLSDNAKKRKSSPFSRTHRRGVAA